MNVYSENMRKVFVYVAISCALTLIVWVHWSSDTEYTNTIIYLNQNNKFTRNFLIQPSNRTCEGNPFLIIIVTSYVGHVELRNAHRRAYPKAYLDTFNSTRVFLLAKIPDKEKYPSQAIIQDESNTFGDILQGSFLENYRNLTYKHLMGLQWAATECSRASFILKIDDDTVFNLEKTYELLVRLNNEENFLMGYILNNTTPKRNSENKWFVTKEEYQQDNYPPYLSGWYYITTPRVANKLCNEAIYQPYFWIDDIFITGLLVETLGLRLRDLPKGYWLEYYELLECCLTDMVKKFIKCEHVVGPNGGRNNLIVEFHDALMNCDRWNNCTSRSIEQSISKTCVAFRERNIFSNGKPEIEYIKL